MRLNNGKDLLAGGHSFCLDHATAGLLDDLVRQLGIRFDLLRGVLLLADSIIVNLTGPLGGLGMALSRLGLREQQEASEVSERNSAAKTQISRKKHS